MHWISRKKNPARPPAGIEPLDLAERTPRRSLSTRSHLWTVNQSHRCPRGVSTDCRQSLGDARPAWPRLCVGRPKTIRYRPCVSVNVSHVDRRPPPSEGRVLGTGVLPPTANSAAIIAIVIRAGPVRFNLHLNEPRAFGNNNYRRPRAPKTMCVCVCVG